MTMVRRTVLLLCFLLSLPTLALENDYLEEAKERVRDAMAPEKRETVKGPFFGLGPAFMGALGVGGMGYYFNGGYAFNTDIASIRIGGSAAFNDGALFTQAGIGASYFAMRGEVTPFVGADFGIGWAKAKAGAVATDDSLIGFVLSPVLGAHLLRGSDVSLEVALISSFLIKSNPLGSPSLWGFRAAIHF